MSYWITNLFSYAIMRDDIFVVWAQYDIPL